MTPNYPSAEAVASALVMSPVIHVVEALYLGS